MADTKIKDLTDGVTANTTDRIPITRDPTGTPINRYITPQYIKINTLGGVADFNSSGNTANLVWNGSYLKLEGKSINNSYLEFYPESRFGAINDFLGGVYFSGRDSAGSYITGSYVESQTVNPAAGSFASVLSMAWKSGGSLKILKGTGTEFIPSTANEIALGSSTYSFADLFLGNGGVINFNNGDVTLTHSTNTLTFIGGTSYSFDSRVLVGTTTLDTNVVLNLYDATNGYVGIRMRGSGVTFGESDWTLYSSSIGGTDDFWGVYNNSATDGATVAYKLRVGKDGSIFPGVNDGGALGRATISWSDLFLASGGVINFNNGDVTVTHSANTLSIAGGAVALDQSPTVNGAKLTSAINEGENRVINGAFDIWQRGTSHSTLGYGSADRWYNELVGGTVTMSRQSFATGDTLGKNNPRFFLRQSVSGQSLASHNARIIQRIEGVGTYAGQTITVLGWVRRSSGTGNMAFDLAKYYGTGGSPSTSENTIGVTTVTLTGSWAPFAITVAVPSISGKTIGSNNDDWISLNFWTSAGSDFNARTNSLGIQTINVDLWGIHIRVGTHTTAACDEYLAPELGPELLRCQRYFYRNEVSASFQRPFTTGMATNSTTFFLVDDFPVPMRTNPGASVANSTNLNVFTAGGVYATTSATSLGGTTTRRNVWQFNTSTTSATQGMAVQVERAAGGSNPTFSYDAEM